LWPPFLFGRAAGRQTGRPLCLAAAPFLVARPDGKPEGHFAWPPLLFGRAAPYDGRKACRPLSILALFVLHFSRFRARNA